MTRLVAAVLVACAGCTGSGDAAAIELHGATFTLVDKKLETLDIDALVLAPSSTDTVVAIQLAELDNSAGPVTELDVDFAIGSQRYMQSGFQQDMRIVDAGTPADTLLPLCGKPFDLVVCIVAPRITASYVENACDTLPEIRVECH